MPLVIALDEAQTRLKDLVANLVQGDEIIIAENQQPVARLIGVRPVAPSRPPPGLGKGSIVYMAPDFDAPLEEFREYTG